MSRTSVFPDRQLPTTLVQKGAVVTEDLIDAAIATDYFEVPLVVAVNTDPDRALQFRFFAGDRNRALNVHAGIAVPLG